MPVEGTPNFNAIAILEIEKVDWRAGQPALVARAAFVNTKNGKTYGQTTLSACWSKETMVLLDQLRTSMETDMAVTVFEEGSASSTTRLFPNPLPKQDAGGIPLGIGEELEMDAPSV